MFDLIKGSGIVNHQHSLHVPDAQQCITPIAGEFNMGRGHTGCGPQGFDDLPAVCYGSADLYLGMLSSQMNNLAEAEQLFLNASTLCEKTGPTIWQAHIKYRHVQVLKRHNLSGRKSVFHKLVGEARSMAQATGMVNLLAKIDRLENESPLDDRDNTNGLTRREHEVLNLIVQGQSNKSIASELNRSLATVATHVRAILSKTRMANRTEAAAFAMERYLYKGSDPAGS